MIRDKFNELKDAFMRLTERQQFAVVGVAALSVFFMFLFFGFLTSRAIQKAEYRVKVKAGQLTEILDFEEIYKVKKQQHEEQLRELGKAKTRLVSTIEQIATQAGVEIGQLRPEDGEPNAEGVIESRVDLRAMGLSSDRLQKFLSLIENAPSKAVLRRLKINRPYKKDTVDIELTVTAYKLKG